MVDGLLLAHEELGGDVHGERRFRLTPVAGRRRSV